MRKRGFLFLVAFAFLLSTVHTPEIKGAVEKTEVMFDDDDDYDDEDDFDGDFDGFHDEDEEDDDYDEDEEDYDEDDEDDEDEDEDELYSDVEKTFQTVKISNALGMKGNFSNLSEEKTVVYPFSLSKKAKIVLCFRDNTKGSLAFQIYNKTTDEEEFEESETFSGKGKKYTVSLTAGKYELRICSEEGTLDFSFGMDLANKVFSKTLQQKQSFMAKPGLGKGTWTTSNKGVAKISKRKANAVKITAVKSGKAIVTFKGNGYTVTYKIVVKKAVRKKR